MPTLTVKYSSGARSFPMQEGQPLYIGRDPACDIVIHSPLVSRRHAVFVYKGGITGVKDLRSSNGTRVNGEPISAPHSLIDGDVVALHDVEVVFSHPPRAESPDADTTVIPDADRPDPGPASVPAVPPATDTQYLPPAPISSLLAAEQLNMRFESPETGTATVRIPEPSPEENDTCVLDPVVAQPRSGEDPTPPAHQSESAAETAPEPDAPPPVPAATALLALAIPDRAAIKDASGHDTLPAPDRLERTIERRMELYAGLADLADERKLLRMRKGGLDRETAAELLRQDVEMEILPTPQQADRFMEELRARQGGRQPDGLATEAELSPGEAEMRKAEDLAIRQWRLCRDSNREDLPKVWWEAYLAVSDEPLAEDLSRAGIYHMDLLGGTAYLIIVESRLAAARKEREQLQAETESRAESGRETEAGRPSRSSRRFGDDFPARESVREREERESAVAAAIANLVREASYLTRILPEIFWRVYVETAERHLPSSRPLSTAVRAFLRYGVLGFGPWWMPSDTRDFIVGDCTENVLSSPPVGIGTTSAVYMDEYLAAQLRKDCPPLTAADREADGVDPKAARAWRNLAISRAFRVRLRELLTVLGRSIRDFDKDGLDMDARIARLEAEGDVNREKLYALMKKKQTMAVRQENLLNNLEALEKRAGEELPEREGEIERRFAAGEHPLPEPAALIRSECGAIRAIIAKLVGNKEAFLPMAVRDVFFAEPDDVNHRKLVVASIGEIEALDPGIFTQTIVPARKRSHRITMRLSPLVVILPFVGVAGQCQQPREGMDGGLLFLPVRFADPADRRRILQNLLADFRWETSRRKAGLRLLGSDTLAGEFMRVRLEWRGYSRDRRERALIFSDLSDKLNWRKVYETYLFDAVSGGQRLFSRNPDLYAAIIGKYIDLPDGAKSLKK